MSKALFERYEGELVFVRELAKEFAKKYPMAAGRLGLSPASGGTTDPHVERLIEAFALLTARVRVKLDDDFPELTDALFVVLYPHYQAPVPSRAIGQVDLDACRGELPNGFVIERGRRLETRPVDGLRCKYRTGYPTTLWPVAVTEARLMRPPYGPGVAAPFTAKALLRLTLESQS